MICRIDRHTNDLVPLIKFYVNVPGLEVLGTFDNHDEYNGVFLGKLGFDWHLEFARSQKQAVHSFDVDDLVVFYPTDRKEYERIIQKNIEIGLEQITPENPYWKNKGMMVKDPDGYRVVICDLKAK